MNGTQKMISITVCCVYLFLGIFGDAHAADNEEKGAVGRWWDNISSRWDDNDKPAAEARSSEVTLPGPELQDAGDAAKAALIKEIESILDAKPAILKEIPDLSRKTGLGGEKQYYYKKTGSVPLKLRLCDKDSLEELLVQVKAVSSKLPEGAAEEEEVDFDALGDAAGLPESEIPRSRSEMIDIIRDRLDRFDEILYRIPGLTIKTSVSGKEELYYGPEGQVATRLNQLDNKLLHDLFIRVNQEATRLNTQRILKQVNQIQQLNRSIPKPPPQPPRVPNVTAPRLPPQPPNVPRVNVPKPPPKVRQ